MCITVNTGQGCSVKVRYLTMKKVSSAELQHNVVLEDIDVERIGIALDSFEIIWSSHLPVTCLPLRLQVPVESASRSCPHSASRVCVCLGCKKWLNTFIKARENKA